MFIVAISRFRGRFPQFDIELRFSDSLKNIALKYVKVYSYICIATDTFSLNSVTQNNEIMLHCFLIM